MINLAPCHLFPLAFTLHHWVGPEITLPKNLLTLRYFREAMRKVLIRWFISSVGDFFWFPNSPEQPWCCKYLRSSHMVSVIFDSWKQWLAYTPPTPLIALFLVLFIKSAFDNNQGNWICQSCPDWYTLSDISRIQEQTSHHFAYFLSGEKSHFSSELLCIFLLYYLPKI